MLTLGQGEDRDILQRSSAGLSDLFRTWGHRAGPGINVIKLFFFVADDEAK